jgi:intracellular sulfur oxidation DsrE/DsrF family protein
METNRAAFLAAAAAGVGAASLAGLASPVSAAGGYDIAAMYAVLNKPARHKQLIASTKIDRAGAFRYAGNAMNAFQFALGAGPGSLHSLVVVYGTSVFLAANDMLWGKYRLFDVLDAAADPLPMLPHTPANPFLKPRSSMNAMDKPDDREGFYHDFSYTALQKRGMSMFVCDNTLHNIADQVGRQSHTDPKTVYADFRANLVPGALVVPAGVAAIILAQEAHFTFLPAD